MDLICPTNYLSALLRLTIHTQRRHKKEPSELSDGPFVSRCACVLLPRTLCRSDLLLAVLYPNDLVVVLLSTRMDDPPFLQTKAKLSAQVVRNRMLADS